MSPEEADFFGTEDPKQVSSLLRLLFEDGCPPWMKGHRTVQTLPRFDQKAGAHRFSIEQLTKPEISARLRFVVENLSGRWALGYSFFGFVEYSDAVLYRLCWNDRYYMEESPPK